MSRAKTKTNARLDLLSLEASASIPVQLYSSSACSHQVGTLQPSDDGSIRLSFDEHPMVLVFSTEAMLRALRIAEVAQKGWSKRAAKGDEKP